MAAWDRAARALVLASALVLPRMAPLCEARMLRAGRPRQQGQAAFAVVRPFWAEELPGLAETLLAPCAPRACEHGPLPVDLVLYYAESASDRAAGNLSSTVDQVLRTLVPLLEKDPCYRGVRVEYAGIGSAVPYPASPCTQFVDMFTEPAAPLWGYSAVYQMELDIRPLREGWLQRLLPAMKQAAGGEVWVVGGVYNLKCMVGSDNRTLWQQKIDEGVQASEIKRGGEWWNNRHINGNAVYSSSPEFVTWVRDTWGRRQGGPKDVFDRCKQQGGYDELMYLEAQGMPGGAARWREDKSFMDCKPVGDHKAARTLSARRLREAFAAAQLVHASEDFPRDERRSEDCKPAGASAHDRVLAMAEIGALVQAALPTARRAGSDAGPRGGRSFYLSF